MTCDVVESKRLRPIDDETQKTVARGESSDLALAFGAHSMGDEGLKTLAGSAQNAQGGVLGSREVRGDRDDALQQGFEREIGRHAHDRVEEQLPPGPVLLHSVNARQQLAEQVIQARRA